MRVEALDGPIERRRPGSGQSTPFLVPIARVKTALRDDALLRFAANGAPDLPPTDDVGRVRREGASIWHAAWGAGPAVLLLHGGLGHAGNWGHQVPALVAAGYRVVVVDTRGHGRSTHDGRPLSYELLGDDVLAVMDARAISQAALVGWSDGACTALVVARGAPGRVAGVFFFACNMDPSGTRPIDASAPILARCLARHARDHADLSGRPDAFESLAALVTRMQRTQPDWSADDLRGIGVPVVVAQGAHDEFITREHAEYLARTIPGAVLRVLPDVSHFAPLQRPRAFSGALRAFLRRVLRAPAAPA